MIKGTGILIPPASYLPGQLIAPAGTRIPFNMSAPPVGWTTDAAGTLTDCTATVRSGSGGTTGGSSVWSGWNFGGTRNANAVTLSVANMPAHSHTVNDPTHAHSAGSGGGFFAFGLGDSFRCNNFVGGIGNAVGTVANTNGAGANVGVGTTGASTPFTPTIPAPQVKYTDLIVGVKS